MPLTAPEFPDRRSLEARQLRELRALLAEVVGKNPFYTAKFREAGLGPDIAALADFTGRAPFTLKKELAEDQRRHPPYGTNLTYPVERYSRFSQTSATTGHPMRWLDTPESWNWMLGCWDRVYKTAGITSRDTLFFAFSFGPFIGFWTAFESATRLGCLCISGGGMRSAARVRTILDTGATVLCCTPTYAIRLAEVAAEESIDLGGSQIKTIIVGGEPGGSIPGTRTCIEKLWPGARVVDHHGMTEIGPVSCACPKRPDVLHVIEAMYIAEVIDPHSGRPAPGGDRGELVLTNLGRTGSPLVRYRTGDVVQPASEGRCECGSSELALLGGILGRTDDMFVVRGVNIYPAAVEDVLRGFEGLAEYRVEVHRDRALSELKIQIEALEGCRDSDGLARRIEAALSNTFGLRIEVASVPTGTLPRFEMKAKRWVRH